MREASLRCLHAALLQFLNPAWHPQILTLPHDRPGLLMLERSSTLAMSGLPQDHSSLAQLQQTSSHSTSLGHVQRLLLSQSSAVQRIGSSTSPPPPRTSSGSHNAPPTKKHKGPNGSSSPSTFQSGKQQLNFDDCCQNSPPFFCFGHEFGAPWFRPDLDLQVISLDELKLIKNYLNFQVRHLRRKELDVPAALVITKYEFEYAWRRRKGKPLHPRAIQYERTVLLPARERMRASSNFLRVLVPRYSARSAALPEDEGNVDGLIAAAAAQLVANDDIYKRQTDSTTSTTAPWLTERAQPLSLQQELQAWALWVAPSTAELSVRDEAIQAIMSALQTYSPATFVTAFGSGVTQSGEATADLDLNVSTPWLRGPPKRTFYAIANALSPLTTPGSLKVLHFLNTPIIKLKLHHYLDLEIDITINTDDGIRSTAYVAQLIERFPIIRPIVLFLKKVLSIQQLNVASRGGLSGFALTLCVAHVVQRCQCKRLDEALLTCIDELCSLPIRTHGISVEAGGALVPRPAGCAHQIYVENPCDPGSNCARATNKWPAIVSLLKTTRSRMKQDRDGQVVLSDILSYSQADLTKARNFEALYLPRGQSAAELQ